VNQKPERNPEQDSPQPSARDKQSRWGFRGMTLRDWLPLFGALLVPIAIAAGTWWITLQQGKIEDRRAHQAQMIENRRAAAERELAEKQAQDKVVQAYLDQMNSLLLNKKLLVSEQGDPVYTLAQARTATVIARLDARHNKHVMQFLMSSGLGKKSPEGDQLDQEFCGEKTTSEEPSPHLLSGADLSGVDLSGVALNCADLSGSTLVDANLSGAFLNSADVSGAYLNDASLSDAYLYGADLSSAYLYSADVSDALLFKADLSSAVLSSYNDYWGRVRGVSDALLAQLNTKALIHADPKDAADFSGAALNGANMSGVFVHGVDMSGADLQGTYVQTEDGPARMVDMGQLAHETSSLEGATMPNGQKYEDWLKSKGSGEDGEDQ
jgi:uncharacterized protein YjbI with pentapeptide repeats